MGEVIEVDLLGPGCARKERHRPEIFNLRVLGCFGRAGAMSDVSCLYPKDP